MKKYYTADRETGTIIDEFNTIEDAMVAIKQYEIQDIKEGFYEDNFYEVQEVETYYVIDVKENGDEFTVLVTEDEAIAISEARNQDYINKRDGNKGHVEIRVYVEDIEDEDCFCFDHNTIEFQKGDDHMTTPQARYDSKNTVQIKLKLNIKTDADIIEYMSKQSNKQGKLKELIRKEIK